MGRIEFSQQDKELQDVMNDVTSVVFDEKIWVKQGLWKIAEVTYSYDSDTYVNETLFIKIGGLDIDKYRSVENIILKQSSLLIAKDRLEEILNNKILTIKESLLLLHENYGVINKALEIKKNILINAFQEKLNLLEYCILALPFELEKAGIPLELESEEISELEKILKKIDSDLFGGDVKDNEFEVQMTYRWIYSKFLEKKGNLTDDVSNKLEYYFSKIRNFLPKDFVFESYPHIPDMRRDYFSYNLERNDYILAFNMLIDAFGKMNHIVKSDEFVGSVSDGPEGVFFPVHEKFDTITIERFFRLGMHEIETHSITDHNTMEVLGNIRGANSTEKDEGLAILMELFFIYGKNILTVNKNGKQIIDINKIFTNRLLRVLMGEILTDEELIDFLDLVEFIDKPTITTKDRFRRLKRNNRYSVQHKDTSYTRGLFKAIEQVNLYIETNGNQGIAVKDLFIGKISFDETNDFKFIKENSGEDINDLFPIFVSDAVCYCINHELNGTSNQISADNFIGFLHSKYPLFDFVLDIDKDIYFGKYSRIFGITNILLQTISHKKIEEVFQNSCDKGIKTVVNAQYSSKIKEVHNDLSKKRQNRK